MRPSRFLIFAMLMLAALSVVMLSAWAEAGIWVGGMWSALGIAALVDLAITPASRRLSLDLEFPDQGFCGHKVPLRGRLATSQNTLPKQIELRLSLDPALAAEPIAAMEPNGAQMGFEVPIALNQRGEHRIQQVDMLYLSKLRLFDILPRWRDGAQITVVPDVHPILSGDIQTQVLAAMDGVKVMSQKGEGAEFHQLRDFVPGMDIRMIDWKRSARGNALVARETRLERNHHIIACVDHGHLMAQKISGLSKLDHAINAALALSWAGILGGDKVGFYSFGARPGQFIAPRAQRAAFAPIRQQCTELSQDHAETNHTFALSHLHTRLKRRSLIVLFSDFVDTVTAELLIENIAVIARTHRVLYVALRDPALEDLQRPEVVSMDAVAIAITATQQVRERASVLDRLRRLGVSVLDIEPAQLTPELISKYMNIKQRGAL